MVSLKVPLVQFTECKIALLGTTLPGVITPLAPNVIDAHRQMSDEYNKFW